MAYESVTLSRDCEAIQIPYGSKIKLSKGAQVKITQSLGGTYTVMMDSGYMVRISGEDADAIGKQASSAGTGLKPALTAESVKDVPLEKLVWAELRTCYDPEIPVNIVDLGLVYECRLTPLPEPEGGTKVDVKMTLTAPGCGMGDSLKRDAEAKIGRLPGIKGVNVELVWEPAWNQSRMSQAAKLQLGLM